MPSLAAPGTEDPDEESTYEVFVGRFIHGFLQDSLRSALQSRGRRKRVLYFKYTCVILHIHGCVIYRM